MLTQSWTAPNSLWSELLLIAFIVNFFAPLAWLGWTLNALQPYLDCKNIWYVSELHDKDHLQVKREPGIQCEWDIARESEIENGKFERLIFVLTNLLSFSLTPTALSTGILYQSLWISWIKTVVFFSFLSCLQLFKSDRLYFSSLLPENILCV